MKHPPGWMPLLLIALASLLSTWLITSISIKRGLENHQTHIGQLAIRLAEDHRKATILGAITSIAGTDPDIRATVSGQLPPDNPEVMAKLRYVFERIKLDNMILMAPDGEVRAYMVHNVKTSITGKNFAWRPYFIGAMAGKPTMYAAFGSNSRERGFYISTPVPNSSDASKSGTPAGVIVTKLGFEEIDRTLAVEPLPIAVLSPEGVVFASNIQPWLYRVMGDEASLEKVKQDKRVNNAYKEQPPQLIPVQANAIGYLGRQLQMYSTSIGWPDPSGAWQLAGFIHPEDIVSWPARIMTAGAIFLLLLLIYTWRKANQRTTKRTQQVISLLNNSGEGFLSFGRNLLVDSEYSRACETMLDVVPAGQEIADLLFEVDSTEARLMRDIIAAALDEADAEVRDAMLSLLPKEVARGHRLLAVDYRRIGQEKFMVILNDITEQRRTAQLLELERRHMEMVVLAVSDSRNLFETLDSFREFQRHLQQPALLEMAAPELAASLYRDVHTLKGLLNQFSFPETPILLHQLESRLSTLLNAHQETGTDFSSAHLLALIEPETLGQAFEADLKILSTALGEDFLSQGRALVLNQQQAEQLNCLAKRLLAKEPLDIDNPELQQLLMDINHLCKIQLAQAIKDFDYLVQQIAGRLNKQVAPLSVDGGTDIWLVPGVWKHFLQSLAHIFRNAVIHGLEDMEQRWALDKDETGHIGCRIELKDDTLLLSISDDGAGLDLHALRAMASARGLTDAAALSDQEAAQLVFGDQISTQADVTELAGRGVGLSAVLAETHRLGGQLEVRTCPGQGTSFHFRLPLTPAQESC